jgi:choline dehydrogenase-like flavoprotein
LRKALNAQPVAPQVLPQGASHHEAGGLIMGDDLASSVADGYGRIRDVTGLYAFDSSVWPDTPAANPHLTIGAVARRQALNLVTEL